MFVSARPTFDIAQLTQSIDQVRQETHVTGDTQGWDDYLMLSSLDRLAVADESDLTMASATAQVVLARIVSPNVSEVQRSFLDSASVRQLAETLQPLAVAPVDYRALLADLERLEEDSEHRCRGTLISAMQSLRSRMIRIRSRSATRSIPFIATPTCGWPSPRL